MRCPLLLLLGVLLSASLLTGSAEAIDDAAGQERFGVRTGYVETFDGLHGTYGDGWDLTLFFTEQIYSKFLLEIRIGAIYLGDALSPSLDDGITNTPGIVSEMRVLSFSVGPMAGVSVGSSHSAWVSAGIGIYSVSMVFDSGIQVFDYSDQHFGFNGGVGVSRRVSMNWSLDASASIHYFGVDRTPGDLYHVFTDGADSPLLAVLSLGATLDLR